MSLSHTEYNTTDASDSLRVSSGNTVFCRSCNGQATPIFQPVNQFSMTSDGQPFEHSAIVFHCLNCGLLQKRADATWLNNVGRIYAEYSSQGLASGQDAMVAGKPRSQVILENIKGLLPEKGGLLDIGTGSGVFLDAAGKHTHLQLCAQDINDNHEQQLRELGVEHVYFGELSEIDAQFDVITAIHVIEHVIDLDSFYAQIKRLLAPGGIFVAQVPQSNVNTFDLLIYDHLFHFNQAALSNLLAKYFESVVFPEQLFKEITVVCSQHQLANSEQQTKGLDSGLPNVKRINSLIEQGMNRHRVAVFGSGPNSVYMTNVLAEKVQCVIDDDPDKIGKMLLGKPIVSSTSVEDTLSIVIPFPQQQARNIASRWNHHDLIY